MKLSPKETESTNEPTSVSDSEYPYGLTLHLDNDTLKKLGMSEPPSIGKKLLLSAIVEVVSISQYSNKDGQDNSASLQITDMELSAKADGGLYSNLKE